MCGLGNCRYNIHKAGDCKHAQSMTCVSLIRREVKTNKMEGKTTAGTSFHTKTMKQLLCTLVLPTTDTGGINTRVNFEANQEHHHHHGQHHNNHPYHHHQQHNHHHQYQKQHIEG